jgi:hypothetical protein
MKCCGVLLFGRIPPGCLAGATDVISSRVKESIYTEGKRHDVTFVILPFYVTVLSPLTVKQRPTGIACRGDVHRLEVLGESTVNRRGASGFASGVLHSRTAAYVLAIGGRRTHHGRDVNVSAAASAPLLLALLFGDGRELHPLQDVGCLTVVAHSHPDHCECLPGLRVVGIQVQRNRLEIGKRDGLDFEQDKVVLN